MKENEIMIGDWVNTPDYRGVVMALGSTYAVVLKEGTIADRNEYDIDDVKPVPLTAGIINANGLNDLNVFSAHNLNFFIGDENGYNTRGEYGLYAWDVEDSAFLIKPLKYVHEVQHVLRFFGKEVPLKITTKHTGWVNIFSTGWEKRSCAHVYESEQAAKAEVSTVVDYITTIKIEWEE